MSAIPRHQRGGMECKGCYLVAIIIARVVREVNIVTKANNTYNKLGNLHCSKFLSVAWVTAFQHEIFNDE